VDRSPRELSIRRTAGFEFRAKGDYARNQPFGPHVVDLTLEVIDVVIFKMREAALF